MNGIVIVDKPQGWTSQDVTARLRRVYATRRIGHGGTLDPMATGVLPVFVGRATRGVEFFEHAEKTYDTVLLLGRTTDTQDVTGATLAEKAVHLSPADIDRVLPRFRGEILQVPPMYSALKVNGKKLYELARKGQEVERQPRPITVFELTNLGFDGTRLSLRVKCSKGTYIRTLCDDLGRLLGCGAVMTALRRTEAASYTLADCIPLETAKALAAEGGLASRLLPIDHAFSLYPAVTVSPAQATRFRNGGALALERLRTAPTGITRVYAPDGTFLGLGTPQGDQLAILQLF